MKGSLSDAFGEIYTAYAEKIYRYIFQLCHDPVMAEDILQTTFLKAIENADRFQGKCSVDTWLCRIAKNTWLDECGRAEAKNVSIDAFTEENGDAILSSAQSDSGILYQLIQDEERRRMQEKREGVPLYQCYVTIKTEQANFYIGLYYMTDRYYFLSGVTATAREDIGTDDGTENIGTGDETENIGTENGTEDIGTDDDAIGEAGEQFDRWINYFRNSVTENNPDSYFIEYVLTGESRYRKEDTYRFVVGNRFARDCMVPQASDEDENSLYSATLAKRMYEITEQVETIEFTIKNKGYDETAKKGKAILFWSFRDEKGQYVNMMKNLYYGPYGFQAADDQEIICCDGVLDTELRQRLEKVFDCR